MGDILLINRVNKIYYTLLRKIKQSPTKMSLHSFIMGDLLASKTDVKITVNEVARMEVMPKITNYTHHQLSERKNHCQHQLMQSKIGDTAVSSQYGHSTVEVQQHYHSSLMTVRRDLRDSTATVVMW